MRHKLIIKNNESQEILVVLNLNAITTFAIILIHVAIVETLLAHLKLLEAIAPPVNYFDWLTHTSSVSNIVM